MSSQDPAAPGKRHAGLAQVVERNIETLIERRRQEEKAMGWQERFAEGITRFCGSMLFVYLHAVIYGGWIVINLGWVPFVKRFDPTLVMLAMAASVEAIFLSTFILITQNRMMAVADKRADLNLQISLLAEHEITRVIKMVAALSKKMGVDAGDDPELAELTRDVRPEKVLEHIEKHG